MGRNTVIELRIPSGNYLFIDADAGDSIEFYVESYGQAVVDQDNLNVQAQGLTVCDLPKKFHAINASPYEMKILIRPEYDGLATHKYPIT